MRRKIWILIGCLAGLLLLAGVYFFHPIERAVFWNVMGPRLRERGVWQVAAYGNYVHLKFLLDDGSSANEKGFNGDPAVFAVFYFPVEWDTNWDYPTDLLVNLEMLLDAGASPDSVDANGMPLLIVATRANKLDAVDRILLHGANPKATDRLGYTAINYARTPEMKARLERGSK